MSILQFSGRGGHHESPIVKARQAVQAYVAEQASDGLLDLLSDHLSAIALYLAVDVLQEYADSIKLSMIERWIMEAISAHQQSIQTTSGHTPLTGKLIHDTFESVVHEGSSWTDLRPIDRAVYDKMAIRLMSDLNLCFSCGTQTDPYQLLVIQGKQICAQCLHRGESETSK